MFTVMSVERKLAIVEAIQRDAKLSSVVTTDEFRELLEYKSSLLARQVVYKNFTDEDGNFTMFEKGTTQDKKVLNTLTSVIHRYEQKVEGTPIFDMLVREMGREKELPDFLRDDAGRWTEKTIATGWYQNSVGVLYHYDGVVWDNVPDGKISDLEFLGG